LPGELTLPGDQTVYTVMYLNGVSEEVVGIDAARSMLINPSLRVEGARDIIPGGTYSPKL
jgi:hypothetical protein